MTAGDGALADFSVAASFVDGQVILALQGEVDVLSAPEFGAFFETMMTAATDRWCWTWPGFASWTRRDSP